MSEVPPGCGPHRKAASLRLSPMSNIEQMFSLVKNCGSAGRQFLSEMRQGSILAEAVTVSPYSLSYPVQILRLCKGRLKKRFRRACSLNIYEIEFIGTLRFR